MLKQEKLQELYKALSSGKELTRVKKFFVSLPTEAAHTGHIVGAKGGFAQRMHPRLTQKVMEIVLTGITEPTEVKRALRHYFTAL